jgi:hypothetical protein
MKNKKMLVLGIALILIATVIGIVFADSWNVVYGGGQRTLILYNNTDQKLSVVVPDVVTANGERFTARMTAWPNNQDIWGPGNGSRITSFGEPRLE